MFIDAVEIAEHCVVVALGVDADGRKHPLGLWEGTTENKTVCNALLGNLIERGLHVEQPRLFVIDGGKAIRAAVISTFGTYAVIHRCREHYADLPDYADVDPFPNSREAQEVGIIRTVVSNEALSQAHGVAVASISCMWARTAQLSLIRIDPSGRSLADYADQFG